MKLRSLTLTGAFVAAGLVAVAAPAQAVPADCSLQAHVTTPTDGDDCVDLVVTGDPASFAQTVNGREQWEHRYLLTPSAGDDTYFYAGHFERYEGIAPNQQSPADWRDIIRVPAGEPLLDEGTDTFVVDRASFTGDSVLSETTESLNDHGPEVLQLTSGDDDFGTDGVCGRWGPVDTIQTGDGDDTVDCNGAFHHLLLGNGSDTAVIRSSIAEVDGGENVSAGGSFAAASSFDGDTLRFMTPHTSVARVVGIERVVHAFPITNPRARIPSCHRVVLDNTRSNRKVGFEVALVRGGHRVSHFYHPAGGRTRVVHVRRAVDRIVVWSLDVRQAHRRCS